MELTQVFVSARCDGNGRESRVFLGHLCLGSRLNEYRRGRAPARPRSLRGLPIRFLITHSLLMMVVLGVRCKQPRACHSLRVPFHEVVPPSARMPSGGASSCLLISEAPSHGLDLIAELPGAVRVW
jgi:hypothetical protein